MSARPAVVQSTGRGLAQSRLLACSVTPHAVTFTNSGLIDVAHGLTLLFGLGTKDRTASSLGCEVHCERTGRRRRDEDRDVAGPFIPGPRRLRAIAAFGLRLRDRLAVEPDRIHRALDAMELQAITAPGEALEGAITAFGGHIEPDSRFRLAEAQVGALELAALVGDAQPVILIQRKCAAPPFAGEVDGGKAVEVDGQRVNWLLPGILHRRPERDHRACAHVDGEAIERNGLALDFSAPLNRLQFAEEVVPSALRQIELAIAFVVEHRRHHDVVADKELIIDPNAGCILWLLQREGAQDRNARSMRHLA